MAEAAGVEPVWCVSVTYCGNARCWIKWFIPNDFTALCRSLSVHASSH